MGHHPSHVSGRVGSGRVGSVAEISRVGSGRVRKFAYLTGRVGSGHPDSVQPAGSDSTREYSLGYFAKDGPRYEGGPVFCVVLLSLGVPHLE